MRRLAAVSLLLLGLAACKGSPQRSATTTTTSTTTVAGPSAYLAFARTHSLGTKDLVASSDDQLLALGNAACSILAAGGTFGQVVQTTMQAGGGATSDEAQGLVRAAVVNLCPEHRSSLP